MNVVANTFVVRLPRFLGASIPTQELVLVLIANLVNRRKEPLPSRDRISQSNLVYFP